MGGFGRPLSSSRQFNQEMLTSIGAFFLALAWWVPNHYSPWLAAWSDACAISGVVVLTGWAATRRDTLIRISTPVVIAAATSALVVAMQWSNGLIRFGGDAFMAEFYLAAWVSAVAVGNALALDCDRKNSALDTLGDFWLFGAIVSVGLALVQWTGAIGLGIYVSNLPPGGRPFANLGQANHLSTLCFIGLCCLGWAHERRRVRIAVVALAAGLLLLGVTMSRSRTGLLQVGLLVGWLLCLRERAGLRVSIAQTLLLGAMLVVMELFWGPLNDLLLLSRGRQIGDADSTGLRAAHWRMLIDAVGREPWFGFGWQQVGAAQQRVALDHPRIGELLDSSHNLFLDLMLWNGVPVALVIIGALSVWFFTRIRASVDPRTAWFLAIVGGMFVHAMVEYPLQYAYFLVPVGVAMGVAEAGAGSSAGLRFASRALLWPAAVLGLVLTIVGREYLAAELDDQTVRLESARIGTDRIVTPPPSLALLTQLGTYLVSARVEPVPGMQLEQLDEMRDVAQRFGYHVLMYRYALAAGLNGQPEVAAQTLARICRINTASECRLTRSLWISLAREKYPQLAAIPLPPAP